MFFILSKTLSFLVMPFTMVCLCLITSVIVKNKKLKTRFFWAGFVLLLFFSNDFISNAVMRAWEIPATPFKDMRKYDLAIVLTGAAMPLEPNDRVYFGHGADRVIHTVQLYKLGIVKKILVSGGSGRLIDIGEQEAEGFKKVMLLMGVPPEDIITESETRNTYESAMAVKKILIKLDYKEKNCVLVTSAFHMRRSLACYRKAGFDLTGFSTDFYTDKNKFDLGAFIPSVESFIIWQKLIKEWVGMLAYKAAGYI